MGRSKWVKHYQKEDYNSRSKKQKTLPDSHGTTPGGGGENTPGENPSERGKMALYHCNYCDKDISSTVRFRCAVCPDFDLCVECFSVGAQVNPHSSNHPYRVMENLSFPLLSPDWNTDEEMLLLEGIAMYGLGNWNEVSEYIGTKTKADAINHYYTYYMNSSCFPLPDLSYVMGKRKEELIAAANALPISKQEIPAVNDTKLPEESSITPQLENERNLNVMKQTKMTSKKGSKATVGTKQVKTEDKEMDVLEIHGYNKKRQEFEVEYDNDAEHILADMEFHQNDTDNDREMKRRILQIYAKRLDERNRRKSFVIERSILNEDPFVKTLSPEEKGIYQRLKVFARFHSKEEHEELVRAVIEERQIVNRIRVIQEARGAGLKTSSELKGFIEGKVGDDCWDLCGFVGAEQLSEDERKVCGEMRMLPAQYLRMVELIKQGILEKRIVCKEDAHHMFKVDFGKVDRVYDMLVAKEVARANAGNV